MIKNLVKILNLTPKEINEIIDDAKEFKSDIKSSKVMGKMTALMFFENSTRTKISFEIAAKKLGMEVINFNEKISSINKGETIRDTLENLYFMGISSVIIRTAEDNLIDNLIDSINYPMKFINAGSGKASHPTQALLDYFTMTEHLEEIEGKKVVIVGDIEHSRVAKSNINLLKKFAANITICAPEYFKPKEDLEVTYTPILKEALEDAKVIMGLRIQKERIEEYYDEKEYINNYRLDTKIIEKYAPEAIIMHPGPVNREIEMTSELIDSEKGQTILEQVQNGVFVRMAILNKMLGGES